MSLDDQSWAEYLYIRSNPRGVHAERWRHINGCARFFNVRRNTITDEILTTYKIGKSPESQSEELDRSAKGGAVR